MNPLSMILMIVFCFFNKSFAYTTAMSAPTKNCNDKNKYQTISNCFSLDKEANHAFKMIHRTSDGKVIKTKYVALLLHGLSDSPYFYKDIAQTIFDQGINVVAPRWSGMGTVKEDLMKVSRRDWYKDLKYGKKLASQFSISGKNIIIGGMSLGGSVALYEMVTDGSGIVGMLMFSPALGLSEKPSLACLAKNSYEAKKDYGQFVRYPGIANKGTCELLKVMTDIYSIKISKFRLPGISKKLKGIDKEQKIKKIYEDISVPIFNVITGWDGAIDFDVTLGLTKFSKSNSLGKSHIVYYLKPGEVKESLNLPKKTTYFIKAKEELKHASVLLDESTDLLTPEGNMYYQKGNIFLKNFLKQYFY